MGDLTKDQKKDYAKRLYLTEKGITQIEIADRVGVSKVTLCRWVKDNKWDELQTSLLVDKELQLARLYRQLKSYNDAVENRPDLEQFLNSKEADAVVKITAAIKNLETETNIAEKMATGKDFLAFVRKASDFEFSKQVAKYFDSYIKSCL